MAGSTTGGKMKAGLVSITFRKLTPAEIIKLVGEAKLDAPTVRVWAGKSGSAQADEAYRARVVEDLRRIGAMAQNAGIGVSCEYHGGTLTDTNESVQALMQEVAHPNVRLYWQPSIGKPFEYCRDGLSIIVVIDAFQYQFKYIAQLVQDKPTSLKLRRLKVGNLLL